MKLIKKPFSTFILWYLRILAKIQLKKIKPIIIGVGGSSGKTSLSSLIALILKKKYKVLYSEGKNSETGIPLAILGLSANSYSPIDWLRIIFFAPIKVIINWTKYDVYIAEMGIDSPFEPKNMSYLFKILKPNIGVLTNISYEHSAYFDELVLNEEDEQRRKEILDLTAKEELLLLTKLLKKDIAVLDLDDEKIAKILGQIKANSITVSSKIKTANLFISGIKVGIKKFNVKFIKENKEYSLSLDRILPMHYAKTICLSIAVASQLGIEIKDAIERIERHFSPPPGRFSVFNGVKNVLLIDSSYNSGLQAVLDILDLLNLIPRHGRKIAILGDLRELGTVSEYAHQKIADQIVKTLDFAVLIGPMMQKYTAPILEKKEFPHKSFLTFSDARYFILTNIKPKDLILIKGSQNTLFLERAVEMLLKNPKDKELLCRRGKFWDEKRQETP